MISANSFYSSSRGMERKH